VTLAQSTPVSAVGAEKSSLVRVERRGDVAVVTMDDPHEAHNTITRELGEQLFGAIAELERDRDVKAIVIAGKPDAFLAGANLVAVRAIKLADEARLLSRHAAEQFATLADKGKPTVACVHGPALGGGFELALACTAAVASDDRKTVLGLPEVKLGLMPAANGALRVAERAGLRVALDLALTGRTLRPKRALALGLVDEVVDASILLDAACALAKKLASRPKYRAALPRIRRWRAGKRLTRTLVESTPVGRSLLFRRARAEAARKSRGHYPATDAILDELECFARRGFRAAADLEAERFGALVVSETAHRLLELFFAQTSLKKETGVDASEGARPRPIERVGVVGAGLMGAGIAAVTVKAGLAVRLKDKDEISLGRGLAFVSSVTSDLTYLSGTTDYTGLRHADVVIESVYEDLTLKHRVLRELEQRVASDCVIASCTSALPIARIAEAARRPERVVGMHYTRPVHKMPLVEVVRTPGADPRAIATAVALAKRQGKTAIVVQDGVGFYTTRILVPYLNEAAHLLGEGVRVDAIDHALVEWGFPVGPLHLLDEVGIDAAQHVADATHEAFGDRMRPPEPMQRLADDHRRGRKNGRGFYVHARGRRVDPTVYGALRVHPLTKQPMLEELSLRCSTMMVNEALRCLEEGIVGSPRDGDLGAVFGIGFPAFRGGPFRHVDVIGAPEILRRARALEQRHGARFAPAPLLVDYARSGKRFYG
jgi:3-hydroxyacyl-CoA dehydrogenase/enoyl-CoA hydratase/3-hydroxybutyryl-CoA epimerase